MIKSKKIHDFIEPRHFESILALADKPLALAAKNGEILWHNSLFEKKINGLNIELTLSEVEKLNFKINELKSGSNIDGYIIIAENNPEDETFSLKEIKNLAHDFNNILSTISNSIEVLKQKIGNNEELLYLITTIEKSKNRAIDITESLLPSFKQQENKKRKIDINFLTDELVDALRQTFPAAIQINLNTPENISPVMANATEIYRCLLNICINAKEAIEDGGEININVHEISIAGEVAKSLSLPPSSYVKIEISDTGTGIAPEQLENIFNDGFSTKNKGRQSGLGLNIVKKIIEEHNGTIGAASQPDAGAIFTIYLPALTDEEKEKRDGANRVILLADDESDLRELLAELLESYNFRVIQAGDGIETLKTFRENKDIELMIIDRKMPGMDGFECIKKIRETDNDTRIILASGSPLEDGDEQAAGLNINKVLNKPYEFDQLYFIIENLFR